MAGARVEITRNTASPALKRFIREAQGDARIDMLDDMGEFLVMSTRERAEREVSPDGTPWAPLSPAYRRAKQKKRGNAKMLKFDFHMLGDQLTHQVAIDALFVGTNAPYGAAQHFGHTYDRQARSQTLHFRRGADGKVGPRFVPRKKANVTRKADVPAHQAVLPARPWLGVSSEDADQLLAIAAKHVRGMLDAD